MTHINLAFNAHIQLCTDTHLFLESSFISSFPPNSKVMEILGEGDRLEEGSWKVPSLARLLAFHHFLLHRAYHTDLQARKIGCACMWRGEGWLLCRSKPFLTDRAKSLFNWKAHSLRHHHANYLLFLCWMLWRRFSLYLSSCLIDHDIPQLTVISNQSWD